MKFNRPYLIFDELLYHENFGTTVDIEETKRWTRSPTGPSNEETNRLSQRNVNSWETI